MDLIELNLILLAVTLITLIIICGYRVIQNLKTEGRNAAIFFLLIWLISFMVTLLAMGGQAAPYGSKSAEVFIRTADSLSPGIMLSMVFFSDSILYGTIYKERKALLLSLYVLIQGIIISILYWTLPVTFLVPSLGNIINEITYSLHFLITIVVMPMIIPILYTFIDMERIDPANKLKYRLYFIGFICILVNIAFDMPGTLPELVFVWRNFALASVVLSLIAQLLPRKD